MRNGNITSYETNFFYGATLLFECNEGYELKGSETVSCLENGWIPRRWPYCSSKSIWWNLAETFNRTGRKYHVIQNKKKIHGGRILAIILITHIFPSFSLFLFRFVLFFFFFTFFCLRLTYLPWELFFGTFEPFTGWCRVCHFIHYFEFLIEIQTEKVCPDPGIPEGGHRFGYRTVGSTMQFSCQAGYKLHGSAVRTCLENKEWSGSLTTCQNGSKWILPVTMTITSFIFFHRYIWITEMNNGSSHITA